MDLLLLNAVDPRSYQIIPDLGLMYLAAAVRAAGRSVSIVDCKKEGWSYADLKDQVAAARPRVVGIKSYSNEAGRVKRMAEEIRAACPEAVILIGGPHPSMDPGATLREMPAVDYAFLGEAEQNLVPFLSWVKAGRPGEVPAEVRGIAYREGSKVLIREARLADDLDVLPLPAWDLMRPDQYPDEAAGIFVPAFPAAPMVLSRGCPFSCAYCGCRYIAGGKLRYRSLENILAEIDLLVRDYGVKTFTFVDDNFTWNRERAVALFEALARREKKINFTFPNGVRVDSLDEEMLKLMERAGCSLLALGIESGVDATLVRMNKRQTVAQARAAVELIRRTTRLRVTGFFILGYPGETLEEVKQTIRFAVDLPIHHAHFCLFIPLPGTPIYDELRAQGLVGDRPPDPETMTIDRPSIALPGLPAQKLLRLHQAAYLRFYAKPWRMLDLARQLQSPGQFRVILRRFQKLFR